MFRGGIVDGEEDGVELTRAISSVERASERETVHAPGKLACLSSSGRHYRWCAAFLPGPRCQWCQRHMVQYKEAALS